MDLDPERIYTRRKEKQIRFSIQISKLSRTKQKE